MMESTKHLKSIRTDMPVYDSSGEKVGKVGFVHVGPDDDVAGLSTIASEDVPPAVQDELPDELPHEVNERLLQNGFVKISTGLLSRTRYALPEHIDRVQSDEVHLSVEQDELPKF
jgi:hypothetical protein